MFISWCTSLFLGLRPSVCVRTWYQVRDGVIIQLLLTDWIPVKTRLLPLPTQLLLVRRHRLHLWAAHTRCMRYQVGVQLCKGTRDKETYLSPGWISSLFFPFQPPRVDSLLCAKTWGSELWLHVCVSVYSLLYNIRGPQMIKENTPIISIMMCAALLKCHHQYVCQVPWTEARSDRRHAAKYVLSLFLRLVSVWFFTANVFTFQLCLFSVSVCVCVWVLLQQLYNLVAEVIGRRILPPPTVKFGEAVAARAVGKFLLLIGLWRISTADSAHSVSSHQGL